MCPEPAAHVLRNNPADSEAHRHPTRWCSKHLWQAVRHEERRQDSDERSPLTDQLPCAPVLSDGLYRATEMKMLLIDEAPREDDGADPTDRHNAYGRLTVIGTEDQEPGWTTVRSARGRTTARAREFADNLWKEVLGDSRQRNRLMAAISVCQKPEGCRCRDATNRDAAHRAAEQAEGAAAHQADRQAGETAVNQVHRQTAV